MAVRQQGMKRIGKSVEQFRRGSRAPGRAGRATASPAGGAGSLWWPDRRRLDRMRMQGQEDAAAARDTRRSAEVSMRQSSKNSTAMRWKGLQLSAICGLAPAAVAGHVGQGGAVAVEAGDLPRSLERRHSTSGTRMPSLS
jgi:hypothetical protein